MKERKEKEFMPGKPPNVIWLYRILHISNVEYVLRSGIYTRHHANADPNYINIGDSTLISQRNDHPVGITPPNGMLGEYIPFYFGPLSPMLLNIKTGYRGIIKRPQADIIYLCCRLENLVNQCAEWCFTDGHAKNKLLTQFYNSLESLNEIDWHMVGERYFNNTEEDTDRMRRKMAEFLVKHFVPVSCIEYIVVYSKDQQALITSIIDGLGLGIKVAVNPNGKFYF